MNWNSKAVSEVAKEKIWKEHVLNESNHRLIYDTFRINPHTYSTTKTVAEPINRRPKRFLDREQAILEALSRHVVVENGAQQQQATLLPGVASHSVRQEDAKMPTQNKTSKQQVDGGKGQHLPQLPCPEKPNGDICGATEGGGKITKEGSLPELERLIRFAHLLPQQKHSVPMTSTEEIGWRTKPIVPANRRFIHNLQCCEITRFSSILNAAGKRAVAAK